MTKPTLALLLVFPMLGGSAFAQERLAEVEALFSKAKDSIDTNHLAEAIASYVGILAIAEPGDFPEAAAKANAAAAELARIGSRLTLEPGSEWIDARGGQKAGATRAIGLAGALSPAVYLYESFGNGKSPVADAPIIFEFVANSGKIVDLVTTDPYGLANTTIAGIAEPGKAAVIRAYPLFRSRGKSYAFRSVFRDFAYLPPPLSAIVVAVESSEDGASENPQTVDILIGALKPLGLAIAPSNGALAIERFKLALGGDLAALVALGADDGTPYVGLAFIEVGATRQLELGGKKYNIFTAETKASFRLVRIDGTAVFALPLDGIKGQGGSREAAIADGMRRGREALSSEIAKRIAQLKQALLSD